MKIIKQFFAGYPGILILPDDYLTGEAMPLIVFDAGVGEQQGNQLLNLDMLYNNGSPLALARDGKLNGVIDPVTGKSYRFAVVGLQGGGWAAPPQANKDTVNYLIANYNIDTTCILKTGLSAGGQNTWECIGGIGSELYTASVPMSTPVINLSIVSWSKLRGQVWAFHGSQDAGNLSPDNSKLYVNQINALKPGFANLTIYNAGHCCWGTYYDPAYTETLGGLKMNIYQFALITKSNPNFKFTNTTTVTPPPVATTLTASAKINIVNGTATLDPTGSTGNITSFRWDINFVPTWADNRQDGGKPAIKTATGFFPNATFVFDLSVWDVSGAKATATYKVTTDATGSGSTTPVIVTVPPVVVTKTLISIVYLGTKQVKVYSDGTTELI